MMKYYTRSICRLFEAFFKKNVSVWGLTILLSSFCVAFTLSTNGKDISHNGEVVQSEQNSRNKEHQSSEDTRTLKVVLVGDSTTIGNLPRQVNPKGLHLEGMIEVVAKSEGLQELEVINTGKGGETAKRIIESGHYDNVISGIKNVDYFFVRLGINDWYKCDNFKKEFPEQLRTLVKRLRTDHPNACIVLTTICRFMSHEACMNVNYLIKEISVKEKTYFFDLYTPYNQYLIHNGEDSLNVRQPPLSNFPTKYHEFLKPYTYWRKGWGGRPDQDVVRVNDMSLDPLFSNIDGWYDDRHPNSTGYNLIAKETVEYLKSILYENSNR